MNDINYQTDSCFKKILGESPSQKLTLALVQPNGLCDTITFDEDECSVTRRKNEKVKLDGFTKVNSALFKNFTSYMKKMGEKLDAYLHENMFKSFDHKMFKLDLRKGYEKGHFYCQQKTAFQPYVIVYIVDKYEFKGHILHEVDYVSIIADGSSFRAERGVITRFPFELPMDDVYELQESSDMAYLERQSSLVFKNGMGTFKAPGYNPEEDDYTYVGKSYKGEFLNRFSDTHEPCRYFYIYVAYGGKGKKGLYNVVTVSTMKNGNEIRNELQTGTMALDDLENFLKGMVQCTVREFRAVYSIMRVRPLQVSEYLDTVKALPEATTIGVGKYYILRLKGDNGQSEIALAYVREAEENRDLKVQYTYASFSADSSGNTGISLDGDSDGLISKKEMMKGEVNEVDGEKISRKYAGMYDECHMMIRHEYKRTRNNVLLERLEGMDAE